MAKSHSKVDALAAKRVADAKAAERQAKRKAAAPLSEAERMKLVDLEMNIREGLGAFVTVAASLAQIREQRLYRETHDTFEAYCQERWGWSRQRASQLIGAAQVVEGLSTTVDTLPTTERQARELVGVPEESRADAWQEAVEQSGGEPTAADVKEAAAPYKPQSERKPRKKKAERSEAKAEGESVASEDAAPADEQLSEGPSGSPAPATDVVAHEPLAVPDASSDTTPDADERLAYLLNAESALAHAASFRGLGMAAVQTALDTVREVIAMLRQEAA